MKLDEFNRRLEDIIDTMLYIIVILIFSALLTVALITFVAFLMYVWNALHGVRL